MSPFSIIFCITVCIGIVLYVAILIYNKNALVKQIGELQQQLKTKLQQESTIDYETNAVNLTGLDIIQKFASENNIQLEKLERQPKDEDWEYYRFLYQGGLFFFQVNNKNDMLSLRYLVHTEIEVTQEHYYAILQLCDAITTNNILMKLLFRINRESEVFDMEIRHDLVAPSNSLLIAALVNTFTAGRDLDLYLEQIKHGQWKDEAEEYISALTVIRNNKESENSDSPMEYDTHFKIY